MFLGFLDRCHSAAAFGVTPEKGNKEQGKPSQLQQRGGNNYHVQPSASANAINRAKMNSCESRAPSTPSSTSASVVHGTVVAGAAAEVPCHAPRVAMIDDRRTCADASPTGKTV